MEMVDAWSAVKIREGSVARHVGSFGSAQE